MTSTFPFPVQPVSARRQLRLAVVAALKNATLVVGTTPIAQVDSPGNWPYPTANLPAVCVRSATETKTSTTKSDPNFTTVIELDVRAAVSATTAEVAQDAIESLWYQIEQAILQDFYTLELVQCVPTVESGIDIKADGQVQIAGVIGRFRFETFETFDISQPAGAVTAPSVADPIDPVQTITVDITRADADPPFSAQTDDLGMTLEFITIDSETTVDSGSVTVAAGPPSNTLPGD